MHAMASIQQRFHPFFSEYFFQLLAYAFALTFAVFVIIKLFTIESILQSNHRLLLANQSLSQQQTLILNQLNRLESKLITCETAVKTQQGLAENVKGWQTQLDTIKTELHQLQEHTTPTALAFVIKKENQRLLTSNQRRFENSKQTNHIKAKSSHYASDHTLPFQVLNIDMWNGEPMVMVNHQGHTDLLSEQDTLAGWTVININFYSGRITFRNRQGRLVTTSLHDSEFIS